MAGDSITATSTIRWRRRTVQARLPRTLMWSCPSFVRGGRGVRTDVRRSYDVFARSHGPQTKTKSLRRGNPAVAGLLPCARVDSNHHGPYGPQGPQPGPEGALPILSAQDADSSSVARTMRSHWKGRLFSPAFSREAARPRSRRATRSAPMVCLWTVEDRAPARVLALLRSAAREAPAGQKGPARRSSAWAPTEDRVSLLLQSSRQRPFRRLGLLAVREHQAAQVRAQEAAALGDDGALVPGRARTRIELRVGTAAGRRSRRAELGSQAGQRRGPHHARSPRRRRRDRHQGLAGARQASRVAPR